MRCTLRALLAWQLAATLVTGAEPPEQMAVDYARDVAPLLAQHCLECHGPDAQQREAGLGLYSRASATARLDSGRTAIVPGSPSQSELIRRISVTGGDRMPPPDAADRLTETQIKTLAAWIKQGAEWQSHWAFTPPSRPSIPDVRNQTWTRNSIDYFILHRLEKNNLTGLAEADRRTLIRRVYFDLLGIPPTRAETSQFLADSRPEAWERLVDRLLASPLYGQRWARHWLDVARYADSNGGDENHAYPLAWRYRDYAIAAFNVDLPYDQFVQEQVAGDLLAEDKTSRPEDARLTATGFLALGTKILAERDKVKMRADLVNEQIDTIGKSFLALTLGCARCHDHKFDPIPTRDYYALAGILHSTELKDRPISTAEWKRQKTVYDGTATRLETERKRLQQSIENQLHGVIERQAETFDRGNVNKISEGYGQDIGIISDPGGQQNFAEYDMQIPREGDYLIQLRYAALNARPGRLLINGNVARPKAITETTGGWMPEHQQWFSEGVHSFRQGANVLRIESAPLMSHIDRIRLLRFETKGKLAYALKRLDVLDLEFAEHRKRMPKPIRVMAVADGSARNTRVHMRGSHLALGDEVPRGFPSLLTISNNAADQNEHPFSIPGTVSGRLQLARWLTDAQRGAGRQTARVIANRIWHWHFGRGLVETPDNFGVQGRPPSHPKLLDWLAMELIGSKWSLKALQRQILLSATYRQKVTSKANENDLYHGRRRRRLDAESIRDSLLHHAGRLDDALKGDPLVVKSQDPSPKDMQANEQRYRHWRRRSVYLPIVRSNVYRFLTLFDFPNAATPVGRRDATTVPTQALLLLNDRFVMLQAEHLARSVLRESLPKPSGHPERQRVAILYEQLFGRPASQEELEMSLEFLDEFAATVAKTEERDVASWTSLCHALISSSEFIYVE